MNDKKILSMKIYTFLMIVFFLSPSLLEAFTQKSVDRFVRAAEDGKYKQVEKWIKKGINLELKSSGGLTALYTAALYGKYDVVKLLLRKGAKVDTLSGDEGTALMAAAEFGSLKIVELLLKYGAGKTLKFKTELNHFTALFSAVGGQNHKIIHLFIKMGADVNAKRSGGFSVLSEAAVLGDITTVNLLLKYGAKINNTKAGEEGYPLIRATDSKHFEMVKLLVQNGAEINYQDVYGRTALMIASKGGYMDILEYLIKKKADLYLKDKKGRTALDYATKYYYGNTEQSKVIDYLKKAISEKAS